MPLRTSTQVDRRVGAPDSLPRHDRCRGDHGQHRNGLINATFRARAAASGLTGMAATAVQAAEPTDLRDDPRAGLRPDRPECAVRLDDDGGRGTGGRIVGPRRSGPQHSTGEGSEENEERQHDDTPPPSQPQRRRLPAAHTSGHHGIFLSSHTSLGQAFDRTHVRRCIRTGVRKSSTSGRHAARKSNRCLN